MVTNPEDYIKSLKDIGVYNVTFQWETVTHHDRLISLLKENFASVGVALNPSTEITVIPEYLLKHLDLVLIITVTPGIGDQDFIYGCIDKIKHLKKIQFEDDYKFTIQVDGGVSAENAKLLINAGADNLVAGSYIFESNNYKNQVEELRS
jgi:ribulose-phosphate 3-epimerase